MIILQYHDIFQAVRLRKSHDIIILSFCDIVKGQANCKDATDIPYNRANKRTSNISLPYV